MRIATIGIEAKCDKLRQWHKKFVFFPKRIGNEYWFLCYVARKYTYDSNYYFFSRFGTYLYQDLQQIINDKLMNK